MLTTDEAWRQVAIEAELKKMRTLNRLQRREDRRRETGEAWRP